jgi:hypothetical protein
MAFDIRTASAPADDDIDLDPNWAERIVTVVATSVAVLIVAAIAVLMGMA